MWDKQHGIFCKGGLAMGNLMLSVGRLGQGVAWVPWPSPSSAPR